MYGVYLEYQSVSSVSTMKHFQPLESLLVAKELMAYAKYIKLSHIFFADNFWFEVFPRIL